MYMNCMLLDQKSINVQKQGKLFCSFIDLGKAYDDVFYECLRDILSYRYDASLVAAFIYGVQSM